MTDNPNTKAALLRPIAPPPSLARRILERIGLERLRRGARRRLAGYSSVVAVSLAALVPAVRYLMQGLAGSAFGQYLSLGWSDTGLVLSSWKEFALSLVESAPIMEMTVLLSLVLLLMFGVRQMLRNANALKAPAGRGAIPA